MCNEKAIPSLKAPRDRYSKYFGHCENQVVNWAQPEAETHKTNGCSNLLLGYAEDGRLAQCLLPGVMASGKTSNPCQCLL